MANELTRLRGGRELQQMLNSLPAKLEKNIMRSALRAGARVIADEAKANVPVDNGDLKRSIKVSTRGKRGKVEARVRAGGKGVFYAHMVEFGTAAHVIKGKNGKRLFFNGVFAESINHPRARAKPFMRPALDGRANEAIRAVGEQIRKRLTKHGINTPAGLEIDDDS